MQEIWPQLREWAIGGERFALATVVEASRPSPRGIGSALAVSADGNRFIGSVSAGCVENEVIQAAVACMVDGQARWLSFGPDSGFPWEISLSCGGRIRVRVEPYAAQAGSELSDALSQLLDDRRKGLLLSYRGKHCLLDERGQTGDCEAMPTELLEAALNRLSNGEGTQEVDWEGEPALMRTLDRPKRLFVIGAAHIAIHLVGFARSLGFETIVIDPRETYAREERFLSPPDRLLDQWPRQALAGYRIGPDDCLAAMTHDPKIDDEALSLFLPSKCRYIGALGSRKSHAARLKRLSRRGFEERDLERIHGPIGLDIGSETPAEIALSVMAEIVKMRSANSR